MFNFEIFDMKLETEFTAREFLYFDEIESTNKYLLEQKDHSEGTLVLAEKQSKGRGRMERVWYSARKQNLTFSILLPREKRLMKNLNIINLGVAYTVAKSVENLFQLNTELKWPNDILVEKKKICGILIESNSQGNEIMNAVVGIGLNVNQSDFQGEYNVTPTSINLQLGHPVDREKLLAEIANNFEEMLYTIVENPDKILNEWRQNCYMIGSNITIEQNGELVYGLFEDIANDGSMILKTPQGEQQVINFGDVRLV